MHLNLSKRCGGSGNFVIINDISYEATKKTQGETIMEAPVIRGGLHSAPSTQKMGKLV